MTKRFLVSLILAALAFGTFIFAGSASKKSDELAALLPASDGVLILDVQRLFNGALPQILAENPLLLQKIKGEIDKIKEKTGLDLRQFDRLAAGFRNKKNNKGEMSFEPVMLARGHMESNALIEVAKLASNDEFKTVNYAGRTIYVFSAYELVERNKPKNPSGNSLFDKLIGKVIKGLSGELAITAYDEKTVAFGALVRVREALDDSPRISKEVLAMLEPNEGTVGSFGMRLPDGMSEFIELDDDDLGAALDSVRQVRGSMGIRPGKTIVSLAAAAVDADKAENLEFMILGLQAVGSKILKRQRGADKQIYGKMLENLMVRREGNEILLDLEIVQSDLNVIVGKK